VAWNAFVDLLAMEGFEGLTEVQQAAQLVFWYDAEVNNGGHLQYFLNSAGERATETLAVLSELGLDTQHSILEEGLEVLRTTPLSTIDTVEDYVAEALEDKFGKLDRRFYAHQDEVDRFLQKFLKEHFDEFIVLA